MKNILCALLLLCGSVCFGQRVELPAQPSEHVVVFGTGPQYETVAGWLRTHPGLRGLGAVHCVDTTGPLFQHRYKGNVPKLPCVRYQRGDVLLADITDIPDSPDALYAALEGCRRGRCPVPEREQLAPVQPPPEPDDTPVIVVPPSDKPPVAPWVAVAVGAVALLVGVMLSAIKTISGEMGVV